LNIERTLNAIKASTRDLYEQTGIKMNEVNVNINGQHIEMINKRLCFDINFNHSEINKTDFIEVVNHRYKSLIEANKEIIHIVPIDYKVEKKQGEEKLMLSGDFNIITGQSSAVSNIKKCVQLAGLEVNKLVPESIPASFFVLSNDDKEKGVILIDMGAGTTNIAIYYQGIIRHLVVFPFGGNFITRSLQNDIDIPARYAEKLKVRFGAAVAKNITENKIVSISNKNEAKAIETKLKNIANIIQRDLEGIIDLTLSEVKNSDFYKKIGNGIVLTGGSSLIKDIDVLIKDKTGLNVRLGQPCESVNISNFEELNNPIYSTSIGLLKCHLEVSYLYENESNVC
jgi:cell division protein FtsA